MLYNQNNNDFLFYPLYSLIALKVILFFGGDAILLVYIHFIISAFGSNYFFVLGSSNFGNFYFINNIFPSFKNILPLLNGISLLHVLCFFNGESIGVIIDY